MEIGEIMNINDIIIVTGHARGQNYTAALMTYDDYMQRIVDQSSGDLDYIHDMAKEILETKSSTKKFSEIYMLPNRTYQARYVYDRKELRNFLQMVATNQVQNTDMEIYLDLELCSCDCMNALYAAGIKLDGTDMDRKYLYEKEPCTFTEGEIYTTLEGDKYCAVKCFSDNDILFQKVKDNTYIIGRNTEYYERKVKENTNVPSVYGIKWENGEELGGDITDINFDDIKLEFFPMLETLSKKDYLIKSFNHLITAKNYAPSQKMKKIINETMKKLYGTSKKEEFLEFLSDTSYVDKILPNTEKSKRTKKVH